MTAFDMVALAVLAVSAIAGFWRGALRELVGLFAFALAGAGAALLYPAAAPVVRVLVHPAWAAAVATALALFVAIFAGLQLLAGLATRALGRQPLLSGANRMFGLAFGVARALLFVGLFVMVFLRVTPESLRPGWITGAVTFPAAEAVAGLIQRALPAGLRLLRPRTPAAAPGGDPAGRGEGAGPDVGVNPADHGYMRRARDRLDALVESST